MSYFPDSVQKSVDLISHTGAIPVSCKVYKGQIIPALAAYKTGTAPENILAAGYSVSCGVYIVANAEGVYESPQGSAFFNISSVAGQTPVVLEDWHNEAMRSVVFNEVRCVFYDGSTVTTNIHGGKRLSCAVMHCGRLFGADSNDGYLLRWSGEDGVLDWYESISGAGWGYLRPECGRILNLLPYGEKIAAVREFGVSEISAYGTPENFKLSVGESFFAGICKNSAASVGGKIYFLTGAGLCSYSGNISRVIHSLDGDVSQPVCCASTGGLYLLGAQSKALGGSAILVYDVADGTDYLIDCAPEALCVGPEILALGGGQSYVLRAAEEFAYKSGVFDFGTPYKKVLNCVTVDCDLPCDFEVSNGDISRRFTGVKGVVKLNMNGRRFTVTLKGKAKVRSLCAGAEVIDGI